jgi:membrane-bound metal-dependent hydrolase YbcI (DUF457 family)
MLVFGHIGIGKWLGSFVRPSLPLWPLVIGTILPDVIDKPLYYGLTYFTGKHGAELGLISGSRTFGHSLLFLAVLFAIYFGSRSRALLALAIGVATHLFLDNFMEPFMPLSAYSSRISLLFPFYGWQFPVAPYDDLRTHLLLHFRFADLSGELVGLGLIIWEFWRTRKSRAEAHRQLS